MTENLKQYLESNIKSRFGLGQGWGVKAFLKIIFKLLRINEISSVLSRLKSYKGIDFIDEVFDYLNFTYKVSQKDRMRIPAEGKVVIVCNHPLGGLDALAVMKLVGDVRSDFKIVANDFLTVIDNIADHLLPYNVFQKKSQKQNIAAIEKALLNDEAVIFFPAAEVSRLTPQGIRDKKWKAGAARFAQKFSAPILPVHIKARNSIRFYLVSLLAKKLSTIMLPEEIFRKRGKSIALKIGNLIPEAASGQQVLNPKIFSTLLRKHVYKVKKNKTVLSTVKTIIHPTDFRKVRTELFASEELGLTADGKSIFLVSGDSAPSVLREIARLRELTFRKVGEGTGNKYDMDKFDTYYNHLVLWDDHNIEIVGSYRLGITADIMMAHGQEGIYNSKQFYFSREFDSYLEQAVELGRSFIQQKYWGSNALSYLWQGIAAFLERYPDIRYLFGAVSISDSYNEYAKALIVTYYNKWYGNNKALATALNRYEMSGRIAREAENALDGNNYQTDFRKLKNILKEQGFTIPVLMRRYTELCEYGGATFLDFGVDTSFANSIDAFLLLDLSMLKQNQKARYYNSRKSIDKSLQEPSIKIGTN